ncbi:MAG: response regulator, partial [Muribaculaceae bacterium]|nr:response regulator [Muribaculaceae bacterium]
PKGSGIGLALTKAFVELHSGELTVKSVEGKGSEFVITLPVRHVERKGEIKSIHDEKDVLAEVAPVESKAPEFDSEKPLLLFIEDNDDMRTMISGLLGDEYNVALAPNGKEGLRLAARYVPDLIISDVMMPVMDGLECCRHIKEELSTSHIPVLLLTACSMDEQKAQGYDSGADGYLSKPFNSDVLRARCRSLVANRKRIRDLWYASDLTAKVSKKKEETEAPEKSERKTNETPKETKRVRDTAPIDNEFYNRFLSKVKEQMGNSNLNVDQLAAD